MWKGSGSVEGQVFWPVQYPVFQVKQVFGEGERSTLSTATDRSDLDNHRLYQCYDYQ